MKTKVDEKQLIKKLIERDELALLTIYKLYKKPILNFIARQLSDYDRAQDLTQDVFFDFIERARDFRGESSIKTFLFSSARYNVIDEIRRKKIKRLLFSKFSGTFIEKIASVFLDEEIEKHELAEKITKAFEDLPNDYALVLRLKYIEGSKIKAIAEELSLSFKATESLLFRARRAFIKVFNKLP